MRRLYTQLYLHFFGVLLVVGAATSFVFATGWRSAMVRGGAERMALHIARLAGEHAGDPAARDRAVREAADDLALDVTVRAPDGRELLAVGRPLPPLAPEQLEAATRGPTAAHGHGPHGWLTAAPIRDRATGEVRGIVEVSHPRRPPSRGELRPALTLALVLLIVAVATAPLARRLSRPVEQLTEASRRFGGGELSHRVELPPSGRYHHRPGEMAELTRAWNDMAERIERLVRGQKELLANVSHELRSPLARIRMALELLPREAERDARLLDVETDLAELERLIDDVLTTSRLEAGGLPARPEPVDVASLLGQVAARAGHDPIARGREVRVLPLAEPIVVTADGALLKRALWNLVENAAKYGAPPIALSASRAGERVALAVTDEGPGVPREERERVLDPFYRADKARTPSATGEPPRGFGLGLTLARRVAEVHGGTIAVGAAHSEGGVDRGCRVTITLPLGG